MTSHSITKLLLLLTVCITACMAAPCYAATTHGEVFLEGTTITLGDLFEKAGDKAGYIVGPAPAPGKKIVFDATALLNVARNASFDWKPASNYERVTIARASQSVTGTMIKEMVTQELAKQLSNKELDIALDNQGIEIFRAKNEPMNYRLSEVKYDPIKNRFETALIVDKNDSTEAEVIKITGRAMPMVQVAILNHAVSTGDVISERDVDWNKVPVDKAGADAITEPARLASSEMRRSMNSGSMLRLRDVRGARLVTKGTLVTIAVETEYMSLTAQGRAITDGAMGDTVQVLNTQSNRTIDAIVVGSGKVSVTPNNAPAKIAAR